jgi:hypothetical protein
VKYYQETKRIEPKPFGHQIFPPNRSPRQSTRPLSGRLSFRKSATKQKRPRATFMPLPGAFVFPNLKIILFGCLSIGLTESATAALCDQVCDATPACKGTAYTVLAAMGAFTVLVFVLVLRFRLHYSAKCWCVRFWFKPRLNSWLLCARAALRASCARTRLCVCT